MYISKLIAILLPISQRYSRAQCICIITICNDCRAHCIAISLTGMLMLALINGTLLSFFITNTCNRTFFITHTCTKTCFITSTCNGAAHKGNAGNME